jgi:hypothetical protein
VAMPADGNVVEKEAEYKLKYNSLCTEIQGIWSAQCVIVPVIRGAMGTVTVRTAVCDCTGNTWCHGNSDERF